MTTNESALALLIEEITEEFAIGDIAHQFINTPGEDLNRSIEKNDAFNIYELGSSPKFVLRWWPIEWVKEYKLVAQAMNEDGTVVITAYRQNAYKDLLAMCLGVKIDFDEDSSEMPSFELNPATMCWELA